MEQDTIDRMLEKWEREWPGLDVTPLGVFSRINRVARLLDARLESNFRKHGLAGWSYRLLATLRHTPEPKYLTPTALAEAVLVTSGAMTKQLDRLEDAGYLQRFPDPSDRRGILVGLTDAGRTKIDAVILAHIAFEHDLIATLPALDREALAGLLRQLLLALEQSGS